MGRKLRFELFFFSTFHMLAAASCLVVAESEVGSSKSKDGSDFRLPVFSPFPPSALLPCRLQVLCGSQAVAGVGETAESVGGFRQKYVQPLRPTRSDFFFHTRGHLHRYFHGAHDCRAEPLNFPANDVAAGSSQGIQICPEFIAGTSGRQDRLRYAHEISDQPGISSKSINTLTVTLLYNLSPG